jgi:hypothetical protein
VRARDDEPEGTWHTDTIIVVRLIGTGARREV